MRTAIMVWLGGLLSVAPSGVAAEKLPDAGAVERRQLGQPPDVTHDEATEHLASVGVYVDKSTGQVSIESRLFTGKPEDLLYLQRLDGPLRVSWNAIHTKETISTRTLLECLAPLEELGNLEIISPFSLEPEDFEPLVLSDVRIRCIWIDCKKDAPGKSHAGVLTQLSQVKGVVVLRGRLNFADEEVASLVALKDLQYLALIKLPNAKDKVGSVSFEAVKPLAGLPKLKELVLPQIDAKPSEVKRHFLERPNREFDLETLVLFYEGQRYGCFDEMLRTQLWRRYAPPRAVLSPAGRTAREPVELP